MDLFLHNVLKPRRFPTLSTGTNPLRWQILCDFDGTIARTDTVETLFDAFATPEWREIDQQMLDGAFGSREAKLRQIALMRAPPAQVDAHLDGVELDPGFGPLVAEIEKLGLPLTIVSAGFRYSIDRLLARNGIANLDVASCDIAFAPDDRVQIAFPHGDKDCAVEAGTCKCAVMGRLRNRRTVLIGDGWSDQCPAAAADFVFAKGDLIAYCRQEGIAHLPFTNLAELIPHLPAISGDGSALLALADREAA